MPKIRVTTSYRIKKFGAIAPMVIVMLGTNFIDINSDSYTILLINHVKSENYRD
ncbi:MAG: hypothetical protein AAFY16_10190 [Cyanobacteria bacterium J06642_3]